MTAFSDYPKNCDYLRERYGVPDTTGLYEMIQLVVQELQNLDVKKVVAEKAAKTTKKKSSKGKSTGAGK